MNQRSRTGVFAAKSLRVRIAAWLKWHYWPFITPGWLWHWADRCVEKWHEDFERSQNRFSADDE